MNEFFTALALIGLFLSIFILLEFAKRKLNWSPEVTRRLAHIGSGVCGLLDYLLVSETTFLILMLLGIPFILISYRRNIFSSVHNVNRKTFGEIFLAVGVVAAYLVSLAQPEVFIPSLMIITFADSLAGLVSDLYKKPRKMLRGSIVFFSVTITILLIFDYPVPGALAVALALTLIERFSPLGSDNLTVPTAAAVLLLLF
jgi:dolichol kinase